MRVIALISILFLAGCAATGPAEYGPADSKGFGFEEQRIEAGRFRITYRGSAGMPPELVEDYALRRASELTLDEGYDWFQVVARELNGEERGGVSIGAGLGSGSYGRRGGVSVGVGGDLGKVGEQTYFIAFLEVLLGSGEKPDGGAGGVYDARSVLDSLGGPDPYLYEEE